MFSDQRGPFARPIIYSIPIIRRLTGAKSVALVPKHISRKTLTANGQRCGLPLGLDGDVVASRAVFFKDAWLIGCFTGCCVGGDPSVTPRVGLAPCPMVRDGDTTDVDSMGAGATDVLDRRILTAFVRIHMEGTEVERGNTQVFDKIHTLARCIWTIKDGQDGISLTSSLSGCYLLTAVTAWNITETLIAESNHMLRVDALNVSRS